MTDINNLTLEELIELHKIVTTKLVDDYDFFNIMAMSKEWVKSEETRPGSGYITPFTDLYKDTAELYRQTKAAVYGQIECIKENPILAAYVGTTVDRDTGVCSGYTNNYILNKLYDNQAK